MAKHGKKRKGGSVNMIKRKRVVRNRRKRESRERKWKQLIETDLNSGAKMLNQSIPSRDCVHLILAMLRPPPKLPFIDELLEITRQPYFDIYYELHPILF